MTIFKSRQVNLDPWWGPNVKPGMIVPGGGLVTPRPQFEPTRDPKPWLCDYEINGKPRRSDSNFLGRYTWAPRREQFDTPVNRVLVEFRQGWSHDPTYGAANWLESLHDPAWPVESVRNATPEEIEHARRVLTRLAQWSA